MKRGSRPMAMDPWVSRLPDGWRRGVNRALQRAGDNQREWLEAIRRVPTPQREALAYLLTHMPAADLRQLSAPFLLTNLKFAFRVRHEVPCSMSVPAPVFHQFVLPYAQLDEPRDRWRPEFFNRFAETARRSASIQDAVLTLNKVVFDDLGIRLNPARCPRLILSPSEAQRIGWASEPTLAILLADACRAVGIPARIAGLHRPSDPARGPFWVEAWDHGQWHFLAAGVQGTFDLAWFNNLARGASPARPAPRVYSASFARTRQSFPGPHRPPDRQVWAADVTRRYRRIAPAPAEVLPPCYHPKRYICYRAQGPMAINGRLDKPAWKRVPWTDYFVDIEGHRKPPPRFKTRAKMLWDDDFLYLGACLEEPHVWASLTRKNEIIFNDNDFEIFIDPDGDNHNYYEFEVNALNTIWELTLDRPYRDGGPVHRGDNLPGLKSAVAIQGTLNDARDTDRGWSVEVAIPWTGLKRYCDHQACPPQSGDQWRINFSRVEWLVEIIHGRYRKVAREAHPEDNWVWSPQDAIDMHRPERWGSVVFATHPRAPIAAADDADWLARQVLMEVYYLQRARKRPARTTRELGLQTESLPGLDEPLRIRATAEGWQATATVIASDGSPRRWHVRQDSRLWED